MTNGRKADEMPSGMIASGFQTKNEGIAVMV